MNEIKYSTINDSVYVFSLNKDNAKNFLDPKIYTVEHDKMTGFFLKISKEFLEIPSKLYGNIESNAERVISTYNDRSTSTGVLLTGDKGSGKSLTMSVIINKVLKELGLPVIIINSPFSGGEFDSFINMLGECCIVIDEFGKKYSSKQKLNEYDEPTPVNNDTQNALLSLMDGIDKVKRMFVLSENSKLDINDFMLNRPSRIYYHFEFRKIEESAISEYCLDNDIQKEKIDEIIEISRKSRIFSFDMLQAIVEELNRYNLSLQETIKILNINVNSNTTQYKVNKLFVSDMLVETITTTFGFSTRWATIEIKEVPSSNESSSECTYVENPHFLEEDIVYENNTRVVFKRDNATLYAEKVTGVGFSDYIKLF